MFHSNLKLSNYCASQIKSYPKFYQNLIQLWADVSEEEPKDVSEICEEIIWNNRMISSNCQTLFNKCFMALDKLWRTPMAWPWRSHWRTF